MGKLWLPDSRLEMPELLEPGRKPVGNVKIDWEHPLTKGLVYMSLYTEEGAVNLASGERTISTNSPIAIAEKGYCADQSGADSSRIEALNEEIAITDKVTCMALINPDNTSSYFGIFDKSVVSVSLSGLGFSLYTRTSNPFLRMAVTGSTATNHQSSASEGLTANVWQWAVGICDGSGVNSYVNKKPNTYQAGAAGSFYTNKNLKLGAMSNDAQHTSLFNGQRAVDLVFNTALSEQDIFSLQDDPYQFLIPA